MPTSNFVKKGCSITMDDYNKVNLSDKDGTLLLSGQERAGLYYYRCKTLRYGVNKTVKKRTTVSAVTGTATTTSGTTYL